MSVINVRKITGSDTLAGKTGGLRDFPKFATAVDQTPEGSTVVLDWSGVEIATASYFGSTLVPMLRMAMAGDLDRYFVVAGLNRTCLDELKLVLEVQGLATLLGQVGKGGKAQGLQVLGKLDPAYAETLAAVQDAKSVSASNLYDGHSRVGGQRIGKTGWINRLSKLHHLRLVKKQKVGREFVFEAVS
jgi:hypothetical protein